MLDALHVVLISIIFFLILYLVYISSLENDIKLRNVYIKKKFENNFDSDNDNDLPFVNKPIVVYKMEYRNRNLTL